MTTISLSLVFLNTRLLPIFNQGGPMAFFNTVLKIMSLSFLFVSYSYPGVLNLTSQDQLNELLNSKKNLVLKFSATYCPPCKITKEPFEDVSSEEEFKNIRFVEIETTTPAGSAIAGQYKIIGVPTFIYVAQGKEVDRDEGLAAVKRARNFEDDFKEYLRSKVKGNFPAQEKVQPQKKIKTEEPEEPEEVMEIEIEEELTPIPPSSDEYDETAMGTFSRFWLTIQSFFWFFIEKIKEVVWFIINLIKKIFGK